jgi:hypothetical protein
VALCVALAGTASALPGKSRVKKDDIARAAVRAQHIYKNAVRTKHIRARNVTRSKIARRAVNSDLVGQDALTGVNIVEASLGTVPSATNAGKVNNRTVERFGWIVPPGTGPADVVNLNGLKITASCPAGTPPPLSVTATTSVSGSVVHSSGGYSNTAAYHRGDESFDVGDVFDMLANAQSASDDLAGTLTYVRPDGEVVTVTYLAERRLTACVFAGSVIG